MLPCNIYVTYLVTLIKSMNYSKLKVEWIKC